MALNAAAVMAGPVMTQGARLISITGNFNVSGLTVGEGSFLFGIMSGDLSVSELEEYLELNGPLSSSDIVGAERASRGRHIRVLGVLTPHGNGAVASAFLKNVSLSGLLVPEDAAGYEFWIYNLSAALTTGSTFRVGTQIFAKWVGQ